MPLRGIHPATSATLLMITSACATHAMNMTPKAVQVSRLGLAEAEEIRLVREDSILAALHQAQIVFARWNGANLEFLENCRAARNPQYVAVLSAPHRYQDEVQTGAQLRLGLSLPGLGAPEMQAGSEESELRVEDLVQSRMLLLPPDIGADIAFEDAGRCSQASHVVAGIVEGAYAEYTAFAAERGMEAGVPLVDLGGKTVRLGQRVTSLGDPARCFDSGGTAGCGGVIRLFLRPIAGYNPKIGAFGAGLRRTSCLGIDLPLFSLEEELDCLQWQREDFRMLDWLGTAFLDHLRQGMARRLRERQRVDAQRLEALRLRHHLDDARKESLQREFQLAYAPWTDFMSKEYFVSFRDVRFTDFVTKAAYQECMDNGLCLRTEWPWTGSHECHTSEDNEPVACLTGDEAESFCRSRGMTLPDPDEIIGASAALFAAASSGKLNRQLAGQLNGNTKSAYLLLRREMTRSKKDSSHIDVKEVTDFSSLEGLNDINSQFMTEWREGPDPGSGIDEPLDTSISWPVWTSMKSPKGRIVASGLMVVPYAAGFLRIEVPHDKRLGGVLVRCAQPSNSSVAQRPIAASKG